MRTDVFAATLTAAAQEDNGWGGKLPIIPHPVELIIGLIFAGIVYWAMAKYVVPRFEKMYAERTAAIEGGMAKAEEAQAEAEATKREYERLLAEAHAEAARVREQARAEGSQIIAELRERAQAEADRITAAAQQQITAERQQAMIQLRSELGRLSIELASRVVGESLQDEARSSRVVDRFLAELESATPKNASAEAGQARA